MERKDLAIGVIIAIILAVIFGLIGGTYATYLGLLIAGLITSSLFGIKFIDGIYKGACIGFSAGILLAFLALILNLIYGVSAGLGSRLLGGTLEIVKIIYLIFIYSNRICWWGSRCIVKTIYLRWFSISYLIKFQNADYS